MKRVLLLVAVIMAVGCGGGSQTCTAVAVDAVQVGVVDGAAILVDSPSPLTG